MSKVKRFSNQKDEKKLYPNWVQGFMHKGKKLYHPYLEIGFKFDSDGQTT